MTTVWVTSLPRSLSSATMRVLSQGCGLTPFQDERMRPGIPHGANPHGFFESEALNCRPVETLTGLDLDGHCLKVFARNVAPLLEAGIAPTHDILLRRPIGDIIASWDRWFPGLRRTPDDLVSRLDEAERALTEHSVPTLVIQAADLAADPTRWCGRINEFLGGRYDAVAMAALIDPALYHPGGGAGIPTAPAQVTNRSLTPHHLAASSTYTRREGAPMSQPYIGQPVQFNTTPVPSDPGPTIVGGLITGINPDLTVNVRGFADRVPTLVQRPDMRFQDVAPAQPNLDLGLCWPAGA